VKLLRAIARRLPYTPHAVRTLWRRATKARPTRKTLWLHIGAHKTGTTAVQRELVQERHGLMAQGVWFDPMSIEFGEVLCFGSPLGAELFRASAPLLERARRRWEDTIIWSSEFFFGDPEQGYRNIAAVAEDLRALTGEFDVRVVACVRRQDAFLESWYHQHLKRGGCDGFAQFLTRVGADALRWDELLDAYATRFASLRVLSFEKLRAERARLTPALFPELWVRAEDYGDTNPGFSQRALEIAQHCAPLLDVPGRKRLRDALMAAFPRQPGEKSALFSETERAALLDRYAASNRQLAERFLT
jgi:hypothetical protein